MHAVQHGYSILSLEQRMRTSMLRKTRISTVGVRENGYRGTTAEVDEWRTLLETEETASWKTESCEEVQLLCRDGNRWSRNRAMS